MKEETLKVLKMVEEGKLSSDRASELLEAMSKNEATDIVISDNYKKKLLKIEVHSADGDNVNVKLPVKVVAGIIKATGKMPINMGNLQSVNTEELMLTLSAAFESELSGEIVDITSADGDIVKIVIE